jgi:carbamoyl-phosphate synthase/aspartate carbamoyltransferase/dihydroorotase
MIATDHAPHTLAEKAAASAPPGVPGLETALPLMLSAVRQGRLSLQRLTALMAGNPRRIFGLSDQSDTYVEVDLEASYTISGADLHTKCGWTPFAGMAVTGRVQRVVLRGALAYDAQLGVLAAPGSGLVTP